MCRGCPGSYRRLRTSHGPSGNDCLLTFRRGCCGQSVSGRPTRTGLKSVIRPDTQAGRRLCDRYTTADLRVLTPEERSRFASRADCDPRSDSALAWELLYRIEPHLYDRLAAAERLHPGILAWLPHAADTIMEVAAGTGRLTLDLLNHGREVVAVEPALALRQILRRKLEDADDGGSAEVIHGFFDHLPLPADVADLVVACSSLTSSPE